ncbi:hypothetical protein CKM354_001030300 [Cercospora kikuchii]|uniref:Heterokaryon incompatibility domain-containing protein n=1 Tax=Cercospora kikuchii TaxID=84275 RepID=A0A9P3FKJ0_9PEZI|nr:uncharacterized protein CKM354_001030300 [Cercospora kikuchii]GIZ47204.1 hypothetical protein CKM354_001030300 [Cercospora kikuchii]
MADNAAKKTANSSNIYAQLDTSRKEIRVCHVEDALDQEGRVRCRLEIVSLEPARSFEGLENGDLQLPAAMQRPDVRDDDKETSASGTADTATSKYAREVEESSQGESDPAHSNKPVYEAISWTWGNLQQHAQIVLDGYVTNVPENAEILLRRLCFEQQHWTIWLDAICINQADLAERGQQVAIMRQIYVHATKVLVWLGEDNHGIAEAAFNSIDILVAHCTGFAESREASLLSIFRGGYSFEQLPDCDWKALESLFSYSWFTRLWVVQEVLLAASSCCHCGSHSRRWYEISLAAQWLRTRSRARDCYLASNNTGVFVAADMFYLSQNKYSITTLLKLSVHLDCTEPLDKVYGVLGMIQADAYPKESQFELVPDYRSDLAEVFARITKAAIAASPSSIAILYLTQNLFSEKEDRCDENAKWPSWVPRYHGKYSCHKGSMLYLSNLSYHKYARDDVSWSVRTRNHQETLILTLQGILIDRVKLCTEPLAVTTHDDDSPRYQWISRCGRIASDLGFDSCVIALTLMSGMTTDRIDPSWSQDHIANYEEYVTSCKGISVADLTPGPQSFVQAMSDAIMSRTFFTTEDGRIGTGPFRLQKGDLICMFYGGNRIYVLRQQGEHYVFVGTAFVHGLMQGQYIHYLRYRGLLREKTKWFEIH